MARFVYHLVLTGTDFLLNAQPEDSPDWKHTGLDYSKYTGCPALVILNA